MKTILLQRTKEFAVRIIHLVEKLPETRTGRTIANQIIRSGTSVGANYRASCRARSQAEFISKIGIVEEELDETIYWLELLIETNIVKEERLTALLKEAEELMCIFVTSSKTAKQNLKNKNKG
jgi:four helix bundle protein